VVDRKPSESEAEPQVVNKAGQKVGTGQRHNVAPHNMKWILRRLDGHESGLFGGMMREDEVSEAGEGVSIASAHLEPPWYPADVCVDAEFLEQ
jgi:hypothetical protein